MRASEARVATVALAIARARGGGGAACRAHTERAPAPAQRVLRAKDSYAATASPRILRGARGAAACVCTLFKGNGVRTCISVL